MRSYPPDSVLFRTEFLTRFSPFSHAVTLVVDLLARETHSTRPEDEEPKCQHLFLGITPTCNYNQTNIQDDGAQRLGVGASEDTGRGENECGDKCMAVG